LAFQPLSREDILKIHEASLEVMEGIGVIVEGERARKALLDAGCEPKEKRLLFPRSLVERMLKNPAPILLTGRDGTHSLDLTTGQGFTHNFGSVSVLLDLEKDAVRGATSKDLEDFARLSDYLPHLKKVVPSLRPEDVPSEIAPLAMTVICLKNTTKPVSIGAASDAWEARYMLQAASLVAGGSDRLKAQPMGTLSVSPISPLHFPKDITEAIIEGALSGVPMTMLPCPGRGLTSPVTLAGGLMQQNVEELAYLVLAKLFNPECPLIYSCRLFSANMRTGLVVGNDPDVGYAGACASQLAAFYGLPSDVYGFDTGSPRLNLQAGWERAVNALWPVMAGATFISGFGSLNGGLLASIEQLYIDDEIFAFITHRQEGLAVNDTTLAVDVIASVMEGGNFLAQEHTRDFIRAGELWMPRIGCSIGFEEWAAKGGQDLVQEARQAIQDVMSKHEVPPLDEGLQRELDELLKAAGREKGCW